MTLYEILEVSEQASKETIHAAYISLSKRFHPDKCSLPHAVEKMKSINEAYGVLSDTAKRGAYDANLAQARAYQRGQSPPENQTAANGVTVEDALMAMIEFGLLPNVPRPYALLYPKVEEDVRLLIRNGLGRLMQ